MLDPLEVEQLAQRIATIVVERLDERVTQAVGDADEANEVDGEDGEETEVTTVTTTRKRPQGYVKRSAEDKAKLMAAYQKGGWEAVDAVGRIWKQSLAGCRAIVKRQLTAEENERKLRELTSE